MRKVIQQLWHNRWGAEAYGAALSLISLASIIGVISSYQDEPIPEWPIHLTINALIGIFTVLIKTGLALLLSEGISQLKWQWFTKQPRCLTDIDDFDDASRGPLGSFLFLFKLWRWEATNNIAKIAAILTILVALTDPFSQQIIAIKACTRQSDALTAAAGRTNTYTATSGHTGALSSEIDNPMAVAISTGFVSPPDHIPSLVMTTCESGNCTFGEFSSVAVCHSCDEITAEVVNYTRPGYGWNYTLPGNEEADPPMFSDVNISPSTFLNTSVTLYPRHLLDVRILTLNATTYDSANAFQCQLFPCVRTYEASMSKSLLQEKVLSKVPIGFDAFGGLEYVLASTILTQNGEQKFDCSMHSTNDTAGLVQVALPNVDAAPQEATSSGSDAPGAWFPKDCVWRFGESPYLAIPPELNRYVYDASIQQYEDTYIGSIVGKNIWRDGNISFNSVDTYMRNLSDVLTARIRNGGPTGADDFVLGRTIFNTVCVQVRWAWLFYPATLVACGFAFFLALLIQSPRELAAIRSWKSSNLAVLFCSLDEEVRQKTELNWFRDEISDVAETTFVQLSQDGAGKAKFSED
ncbi:hypothetical protein F5Y08DRAFT_332151 [Xylaria arbuscula]|nr:hypothetical protein F5Y08DRAFT_332151 [Xylaria arbuscula]